VGVSGPTILTGRGQGRGRTADLPIFSAEVNRGDAWSCSGHPLRRRRDVRALLAESAADLAWPLSLLVMASRSRAEIASSPRKYVLGAGTRVGAPTPFQGRFLPAQLSPKARGASSARGAGWAGRRVSFASVKAERRWHIYGNANAKRRLTLRSGERHHCRSGGVSGFPCRSATEAAGRCRRTLGTRAVLRHVDDESVCP